MNTFCSWINANLENKQWHAGTPGVCFFFRCNHKIEFTHLPWWPSRESLHLSLSHVFGLWIRNNRFFSDVSLHVYQKTEDTEFLTISKWVCPPMLRGMVAILIRRLVVFVQNTHKFVEINKHRKRFYNLNVMYCASLLTLKMFDVVCFLFLKSSASTK